MILSGWINITITLALSFTLAIIVYHYYGSGSKKENADKAEQPKYRMLEDDED